MIRLFLATLSFTILFLLFLLLVRIHTEPRRLILELRTPQEWLDLLRGKEKPMTLEQIPPDPRKEKKPLSTNEYVRKILEERRKKEELEKKDRNDLNELLKALER